MPLRLLSFLTDVERALAADDPCPDEGTWRTGRSASYHLGLARLTLEVLMPDGSVRPRGMIVLQCFALADGSQCVKATLKWHGSQAQGVHACYERDGISWVREARQVAALWAAGDPADADEDARVAAEAGALGARDYAAFAG